MRYVVRSVDGAEYGPFTSDELRQLVRDQRLGPGDFVRRESGRTWSPFEKIAGLADVFEESRKTDRPDASPTPTMAKEEETVETPTRPAPPVPPPTLTRPRPLPSPEQVAKDAPDAPSIFETVDSRLDPGGTQSTPLLSLDDPQDLKDRREARTHSIDPTRSLNPFVAAGLPIGLLEGEVVQFELIQSFLDAGRGSLIGAVLGHRGRLICTDRRVGAIMPGFGRSSMSIVWLDRAETAAVRSRTSIVRMIFGVVCLLYAVYALVGSLAVGAALTALGGAGNSVASVSTMLGLVLTGIAALLGLVLVLTARGRTVIVGDPSSGIAFACAAASPWHLAKIDEGRMRFHDSSAPADPPHATPSTF
jgi:hypothetical protein